MRPNLVFRCEGAAEDGRSVIALAGKRPGAVLADGVGQTVDEGFCAMLGARTARSLSEPEGTAVGTDHMAVSDPVLYPLAHAWGLGRRELLDEERLTLAAVACVPLWGSTLMTFTHPAVVGALVREITGTLRRPGRFRSIELSVDGDAQGNGAGLLVVDLGARTVFAWADDAAVLPELARAFVAFRESGAPIEVPCVAASLSVRDSGSSKLVEQAFGLAFEPLVVGVKTPVTQERVLALAAAVSLYRATSEAPDDAQPGRIVRWNVDGLRTRAELVRAVPAEAPFDWTSLGAMQSPQPAHIEYLRGLRAACAAVDTELGDAIERICMDGTAPTEPAARAFAIRAAWLLGRFAREHDPLVVASLPTEVRRVAAGEMPLADLLVEATGAGGNDLPIRDLLEAEDDVLLEELAAARSELGFEAQRPGAYGESEMLRRFEIVSAGGAPDANRCRELAPPRSATRAALLRSAR